jgi:hypothetical protein
MIKKNDPLVGAVQKIMKENAIRYQVEQKLCEELGIYSKNALPNEHKANYDALLEQRIKKALAEENPLDKKFGSDEDADADSKSRGIRQDRTSFSPDGSSSRSQTALKKTDSSGAEKSLKAPDAAGDTTRLTQNTRRIEKSGQRDMSSDITSKTIRPDANDGKGSDSEVSAKSSYETKSVSEAALHPNQQKLDVHEPEKDKLTADDFKMLRSKKKPVKMDEAEEGEETREGGAVTKDGKAVVSPTAMKAEPKEGPSASDRSALTNKIKSIMKEAKEKMEMDEAAKSKSQQRLFGAALATRRGESEPGSRKIAKLAADVSEPELKKFASTKLKGLPEKKKITENQSISFNSVMEEIKRKLGEKKVKEIEEQDEDPNKPYKDTPLSPGDTFDARQTADKMQSTPAETPAPAPKPAAAPSLMSRAASALGIGGSKPSTPTSTPALPSSAPKDAAGNRSIRAGLNTAMGKTPTTGPQAGVVPTNIEKEKKMAPTKAPATALAPANIASQQKLAPVKPTEQEPGFSGEAGKKIQAAGAANDTTPEPGYSGEAGKTLEKATAAPAPAAAPKQTFGQAFAAARKAAGGAGGSFKWTDPKTGKTSTFQTNVKGEKYQAAGKLKPVAMRESLESSIRTVLKD